jgi:hypothetical protein
VLEEALDLPIEFDPSRRNRIDVDLEIVPRPSGSLDTVEHFVDGKNVGESLCRVREAKPRLLLGQLEFSPGVLGDSVPEAERLLVEVLDVNELLWRLEHEPQAPAAIETGAELSLEELTDECVSVTGRTYDHRGRGDHARTLLRSFGALGEQKTTKYVVGRVDKGRGASLEEFKDLRIDLDCDLLRH